MYIVLGGRGVLLMSSSGGSFGWEGCTLRCNGLGCGRGGQINNRGRALNEVDLEALEGSPMSMCIFSTFKFRKDNHFSHL